MERRLLTIPWGCHVVSEDGWSGRLQGAYLAPRSQQISHVLIRHGFPGQSQQAKLDKVQQDADGTLLLPLQREDSAAPARGSVPFTAKTLVHCLGGASLPLRGLVLDRQRLHVEYLLVGSKGDARAIPMSRVEKLASGSPSVALSQADIETLPVFRPDAEAQGNTVAALAQADPTEDLFAAVQVQVVDGTAYLTGNVRLPIQKEDAAKAVASARGVLNVESALTTDWDLSISIAQAMAENGLMRQGLVTVKSSLGRVRLSGHLATQELVESAVAVATAVAGVRSVEHNIQVKPLPAQEPATVAVAE